MRATCDVKLAGGPASRTHGVYGEIVDEGGGFERKCASVALSSSS